MNGIKIARRHSGGGTVYHDLGNLNISILTSLDRHCRKRNLKLIAEYLNKSLKFFTNVAVTERDDLILTPSGSKISGTAARISHGRAYHHFTLLVDVCLNRLRETLNSTLKGKIETNATRSVRAKSVGYLAQKKSATNNIMTKQELMDEVRTYIIDALQSQYHRTTFVEWSGPTVRASVDNIEDDIYPGLIAELRQLRSEDWIFGCTPKFHLNIYGTGIDDFYDIIVEAGRIKESTPIHKDFPIGERFQHIILKSEFRHF